MHVDEFIECHLMGTDAENYARWMFVYFRHPAAWKLAFEPFMKKHKLFCDYKEKRYRVTGASRFGDIWLTSDFERYVGYDIRVDLDECCNWSNCADKNFNENKEFNLED